MQKTRKLITVAIKSKIITEEDDLMKVLKKSIKRGQLHNGDIVVISSKVVAVTQGRVIKINNQKEFDDLVKGEADQVLGGDYVTLTLKNNIFIPWAGIDRSNIQPGQVVLWPKNPYKVAEELLQSIKKDYKLQKAGVIIVDSFCTPLRKGVTGIAIGYAGFKGVVDHRGKKDLYGNILKVTQENIVDGLATMANLVMGQAKEQTPFAIIQNAPVKFSQKTVKKNEVLMGLDDCLYKPLYKNVQRNKD